MKYAEGDVNSNAKGSGARANAGNIDLTLIPMLLLGGVTRSCLNFASTDFQ